MKERYTKKMMIAIQPSLHEKFKKQCEARYFSISQVVRMLMLEFIGDRGNGKETMPKK